MLKHRPAVQVNFLFQLNGMSSLFSNTSRLYNSYSWTINLSLVLLKCVRYFLMSAEHMSKGVFSRILNSYLCVYPVLNNHRLVNTLPSSAWRNETFRWSRLCCIDFFWSATSNNFEICHVCLKPWYYINLYNN